MLVSLFIERLRRLESELESLRLSVVQHIQARRVREFVKSFREIVYEIYAFLRYREEYGANRHNYNRYDHPHLFQASTSPDVYPTIPPQSVVNGPNAAHLKDEIHAMLFMIQVKGQSNTAANEPAPLAHPHPLAHSFMRLSWCCSA